MGYWGGARQTDIPATRAAPDLFEQLAKKLSKLAGC